MNVLLYVQEVVTHFVVSYYSKMGHYCLSLGFIFLALGQSELSTVLLYVQEVVTHFV